MIDAALKQFAKHGRLVLVTGLLTGIFTPELALTMRPSIGPLVGIQLFLAALRIGAVEFAFSRGRIAQTAGVVLLLQLAMPLAAVWLFYSFEILTTPSALFFILMLAAPTVTGSSNLTIMTGNDGGPALRLLIYGVALVPFTVIPVFAILPNLGEPTMLFRAASGLFLLLVAVTGLAFLIKAYVLRRSTERTFNVIDGMSAVVMAFVVIGIMSAVGPALREAPLTFMKVLLLTAGANFAIQIIAAIVARWCGFHPAAAAFGIAAANRNVALFMTTFSPDIIDPLLLYIGCYQISMYLTPTILHRFYRLH